MPKIPNLFNGNQINSECNWVLRGAHATKMYDGAGYILEETRDYPLGEVDQHTEFLADAIAYHEAISRPWSYELCGPGIKGNHEQQPRPILIPHGRFIYQQLTGQEISYEKVRSFLAGRNTQGVVFWEDIWDYTCRKAKVTQADFSMKRNLKGDQE